MTPVEAQSSLHQQFAPCFLTGHILRINKPGTRYSGLPSEEIGIAPSGVDAQYCLSWANTFEGTHALEDEQPLGNSHATTDIATGLPRCSLSWADSRADNSCADDPVLWLRHCQHHSDIVILYRLLQSSLSTLWGRLRKGRETASWLAWIRLFSFQD